MEKIMGVLNEIKKINSVYELSNEIIDKNIEEIENAKVCTPIIGKFSTGKSAILNTVFGYSKKILKEDITPETAVPNEIYYDEIDDKVTVVSNDGAEMVTTISEYRNLELDANSTKCVRIGLRNTFLKSIEDVMLVDMPGFESGYEVHNKAIDRYLPKSLAYIVTFSSEDMVIKSSIGNILKELCLHDMPIFMVITKCDKVETSIIEVNLEKLKEGLKKYIGEKEVEFCFTSSYDGDAEELKRFLLELQDRSQIILENNYKYMALSAAQNTENYLSTSLKNNDLSESELDEKEDELNKEMNELNKRIKEEQENFIEQIEPCVVEIKADIKRALQAEESTFINILLNNQVITEQVNVIVRDTVTSSIQRRFIPKVQKYINKISDCINVGHLTNMGFSANNININTDNITKKILTSAVAWAAAAIIGLPILGGLAVGVVAIISAISNIIQGSRRREEAKAQIRQKLNTEVFPSIVREVGSNVEKELTKQIEILNETINEEINSQKIVLEMAMNDLKKKQMDENQNKENLVINLKQDLERIRGIKNEL